MASRNVSNERIHEIHRQHQRHGTDGRPVSRARFYQLVGTTFPWPLYDIATRRPFYDEEASANLPRCAPPKLWDRRQAADVLRPPTADCDHAKAAQPSRSPKKASDDNYGPLMEGLKSLGLVVGPAQVEAAIKELLPRWSGAICLKVRFCGPCSSISSARIRRIVWGDK